MHSIRNSFRVSLTNFQRNCFKNLPRIAAVITSCNFVTNNSKNFFKKSSGVYSRKSSRDSTKRIIITDSFPQISSAIPPWFPLENSLGIRNRAHQKFYTVFLKKSSGDLSSRDSFRKLAIYFSVIPPNFNLEFFQRSFEKDFLTSLTWNLASEFFITSSLTSDSQNSDFRLQNLL